MNGVLIVDKPAGPTSHDVVARVRRAVGISRIGHTGTLDPLATGVLALVIGRATRLAQFLSADEKEYIAGIRLGWSTPTYDAEERTVRGADGVLTLSAPQQAPPAISEPALVDALAPFVGTYRQMPPPFSAKKVAGTPAYLLARLQKEVELTAAAVTVHELELLAYAGGLATIRVLSSSGFYVRSLAHDVGGRLGCGAHLESLRRIRAGDFREAEATPLDVVQAEGATALQRLRPMASLLASLPQVVVNERGARRAAHGNALIGEDLDAPGAAAMASGIPRGPVRVLDADGALLAIGKRDGDILHPVVVLV